MRHMLAGLALVVVFTGCSSSSEAPRAAPRSSGSVAASAETTSAFGIATWTIDDDGTNGIVRGLASDGAVVEAIASTVETTSSGGMDVVLTSATDHEASVRFRVDANGDVAVEQDALTPVPRARAIAARAVADLWSWSKGSTTLSLATPLHPSSVDLLPGGPAPLIRKCTAVILTAICLYVGEKWPDGPPEAAPKPVETCQCD